MENQPHDGKNVADSGFFKKFMGRAEEYVKKPSRVKDLLNDAYQKATDKKDVGSIAHEAWESLQTLSRLIRSAVSGEYIGLPTSTIVGAVAVLLYFLSPIDLVPDFLPVIGLLDDVALLAWFMSTIKSEMDRFSDWEKTKQTHPGSHNGEASGAATPATGNSGTFDAAALAKTEEAQRVKDFTAHDLNTGETPNDSAIRATSSGSGEPNVRAATTDSTRIPSSNADDAKAGGNIR